jgi:hypothetical protein
MLMSLRIVGDLGNKFFSSVLSNIHRKIGVTKRIVKDQNGPIIPCICNSYIHCGICNGHGVVNGYYAYHLYYNDSDVQQVNDIANLIRMLPTDIKFETKVVFKECGGPKVKNNVIVGRDVLITGFAAVGCGVKGEKLSSLRLYKKKTHRVSYVIFSNAILIVRYVQKKNISTHFEFGDGVIEYVFKDKKDSYGITTMTTMVYRFSSVDNYVPIGSYKIGFPEEAVQHAINKALGHTKKFYVSNYEEEDNDMIEKQGTANDEEEEEVEEWQEE